MKIKLTPLEIEYSYIDNPYLNSKNNSKYEENNISKFWLKRDIFNRIPKKLTLLNVYGYTNNKQNYIINIHGFLNYFVLDINDYIDTFKDKNFIIKLMMLLEITFIEIFLPKFKSKISQDNIFNDNISIDEYSKIQKIQIIYSCEIKYKYDFYGFNKRKKAFLKIKIYNNNHIKYISDIFMRKIIWNNKLLVYENHIDILMKFNSKKDIYIFNDIILEDPLIRKLSKNKLDFYNDFPKLYNKNDIPYEFDYKEFKISEFKRTSYIYYELDIHKNNVKSIYKLQNDDNFEKINLTKPLEIIWKEEISRRNLQNLDKYKLYNDKIIRKEKIDINKLNEVTKSEICFLKLSLFSLEENKIKIVFNKEKADKYLNEIEKEMDLIHSLFFDKYFHFKERSKYLKSNLKNFKNVKNIKELENQGLNLDELELIIDSNKSYYKEEYFYNNFNKSLKQNLLFSDSFTQTKKKELSINNKYVKSNKIIEVKYSDYIFTEDPDNKYELNQ